MQDKIKTILERHVFIYDENSDKLYPEGVDKAAEAIVKLFQSQPVDRVRAMSALVHQMRDFGVGGKIYAVPSGHRFGYEVLHFGVDGKTHCSCDVINCHHARAVKLHRGDIAPRSTCLWQWLAPLCTITLECGNEISASDNVQMFKLCPFCGKPLSRSLPE